MFLNFTWKPWLQLSSNIATLLVLWSKFYVQWHCWECETFEDGHRSCCETYQTLLQNIFWKRIRKFWFVPLSSHTHNYHFSKNDKIGHLSLVKNALLAVRIWQYAKQSMWTHRLYLLEAHICLPWWKSIRKIGFVSLSSHTHNSNFSKNDKMGHLR